MKLRLTVAAVAVALASTKVSAEESPYSGNAIYKDCKAVATSFVGDSDTFARGVCVGIVNELFYSSNGSDFCAPENIGVFQGVRVVVKYMDDNPQELHKKLPELVMRSFALAWPCKS